MRLKGVKAIAAWLGSSPEFVALLVKTDAFPGWFEGKVPVVDAAVLSEWAKHYLMQVTHAVPERIDTRESIQ